MNSALQPIVQNLQQVNQSLNKTETLAAIGLSSTVDNTNTGQEKSQTAGGGEINKQHSKNNIAAKSTANHAESRPVQAHSAKKQAVASPSEKQTEIGASVQDSEKQTEMAAKIQDSEKEVEVSDLVKIKLPALIETTAYGRCYKALSVLDKQQQENVLAVFNTMQQQNKIHTNATGLFIHLAHAAAKQDLSSMTTAPTPVEFNGDPEHPNIQWGYSQSPQP
jgi:hypothetical protein